MEHLTREHCESIRIIREQLCCILCSRVFDDPHSLDCKHNFCRDCIFVHIRKRVSVCPKCNLPTRPSEVTRNQFLQSILVAWNAVEGELFAINDPESAAVAAVARQQQRQEEKNLSSFVGASAESEVVWSMGSRGTVPNNKWSVDTFELKQQANAEQQRTQASASQSMALRIAAKNAVLAQEKEVKQLETRQRIAPSPSKSVHQSSITDFFPTPTVPITTVETSHPVQPPDKVVVTVPTPSEHSVTVVTSISDQVESSPLSPTQTQMPSTSVCSPPENTHQKIELSTPTGMSSPLSEGYTPTCTPSSIMPTQEVQAYREKIQAHGSVLARWEAGNQSVSEEDLLQKTETGTIATTQPPNRIVPTISAVKRLQPVRRLSLDLAADSSTLERRSLERRYEVEVGGETVEEADEEEECTASETQMPEITMAESLDLLSNNEVATIQEPTDMTYMQAQPQSIREEKNLHHTESAACTQLPSQSSPPWLSCKPSLSPSSIETPTSGPNPLSRISVPPPGSSLGRSVTYSPVKEHPHVVVPSSQAMDGNHIKVASCDLEASSETVDVVEESQVPFNITSPSKGGWIKKRKRASRDFEDAITNFHQSKATTTPGRQQPLKRISSLVTNAARVQLAASNGCKPKCSIVIVGTHLTSPECHTLSEACKKMGGQSEPDFESSRCRTKVTHLLTHQVTIHDTLRCKRSAKYMHALSEGIYIIDYSWVTASLEAGHWLPEEPYEITGDVHCTRQNIPRQARLRRERTGCRNEIFQGYRLVIFNPPSDPDPTLDSLWDLVQLFGAEVLNGGEEETQRAIEQGTSDGFQTIGIVSKRMDSSEARILWEEYHMPIVRAAWILDSISILELLGFDEYYPY